MEGESSVSIMMRCQCSSYYRQIQLHTMQRTLSALQSWRRTCEERYLRCLPAINADLRELGMRAEVDGIGTCSRFRLYYIGLDDIYADAYIHSSPIYCLKRCEQWLRINTILHYRTYNDGLVRKLRALKPLPNPIQWAIADCIRWDNTHE
jgi:hypothetical protein